MPTSNKSMKFWRNTKKGDGFESYDKLSEDDRKKLQAPINTLAEELGKLRGTLGLN